MSDLLIQGHLGLGDHLVTNAIIRHFASTRPTDTVIVLCKPHNSPTLNFMWRDVSNIETFNIADDNEAKNAIQEAKKAGYDTFGLGFFGEQPFNPKEWDKEMYRQAGLSFKERWNGFKITQQPSRELPVPEGRFAFVHHDPARGFTIPESRLPKGIPLIYADPVRSGNLCDWWTILERADQIDVIDSCFAILLDSLPVLKCKTPRLHLYARPGALPPSYAKDWEILRV